MLSKGLARIIQRFVLAPKIFPNPLREVLPLYTCLLKEFCKDMNSDHEVFLFDIAVRWLSKGDVIENVFKLKYELKSFFFGQLNNSNFILQDKDYLHVFVFKLGNWLHKANFGNFVQILILVYKGSSIRDRYGLLLILHSFRVQLPFASSHLYESIFFNSFATPNKSQ